MSSSFSDPSCDARMMSYMPSGIVALGGNGTTISEVSALVAGGLKPFSVNTTGCAAVGTYHMASTVHINETATANVIKINTIADVDGGGAINTFVTMSSCDGTSVFNVSSPGVFVVKGQSVVIIVERRRAHGGNNSTCEGSSTVLFELESLERYCGLGYLVPECTTTTAILPAISPAARNYKRSMALAFFTVCATLAASVIA